MFITALNGVITGVHTGSMDGLMVGTPYYGHEKTALPEGCSPPEPLRPVDHYNADWTKKSDRQLVSEGLSAMPAGYTFDEAGRFRKMTGDEKALAGVAPPPAGKKVEGGKIVDMSLREMLDAGQLSREEYTERVTREAQGGLDLRLSAWMGAEAVARAEIDADYADRRKKAMAALLDVKKQKGWPEAVKWPE